MQRICLLLGVPFDAVERVVEAVASQSQRNGMGVLRQLRAHGTSLVEGQQLLTLHAEQSCMQRAGRRTHPKIHRGPHVAPGDRTEVPPHRVRHEVGVDDVPEYLKRMLVREYQVSEYRSRLLAKEGGIERK
jgi:hypothetical protein